MGQAQLAGDQAEWMVLEAPLERKGLEAPDQAESVEDPGQTQQALVAQALESVARGHLPLGQEA
jgi:hypothetical protein